MASASSFAFWGDDSQGPAWGTELQRDSEEEEVELGAFRLPAGVRRPKGGAAGQACGCRGSAARTPGHRPARPARTTRCWSLAAGDPAAGPGTETQRLLCARRSPAPKAWQGLQLPLPLPPRSDGRSQR